MADDKPTRIYSGEVNGEMLRGLEFSAPLNAKGMSTEHFGSLVFQKGGVISQGMEDQAKANALKNLETLANSDPHIALVASLSFSWGYKIESSMRVASGLAVTTTCNLQAMAFQREGR